ncbi:MAG: hypothetical protein JNL01_09175 [Bdellovibrionales bacterium]|nr:hypothetical protein [Bdellovibrionales bacterium]
MPVRISFEDFPPASFVWYSEPMVPRDDDDPWRRQRDREDEEDLPSLAKKRALNSPGGGATDTGGKAVGEDKLLQLLEQVPQVIEQVNNLYQQFFSGVERVPPTERRKQLDQMALSIQMTPKVNAGLQFKANTVYQAYQSAKDRWDRMLKDLESGKLKRTAGPKRP